VLLALVVLVPRFRRNWWLIGVTLFAGWHLLEHAVIMSTYLRTGVVGSPGLLSVGCLIGGGPPLARPDLHFLYNLAETVPLVVGWKVELEKA